MSKVSLELIQQLRERTGVGMMDAKKALQETDGDMEKAIEVLRKKGAALALKRSGNTTAEGLIHAYIHPGSRLGVMIEMVCETDFVARTDEFKRFANDVCMHIAAFNPKFISPEQVDQAFIEKEKARITEDLAATKKPAAVIEQIVEGKLNKIYSEICLLQQPFVKNDKITVDDALKDLIAKMGENIKIKRFVRFEIGGE